MKQIAKIKVETTKGPKQDNGSQTDCVCLIYEIADELSTGDEAKDNKRLMEFCEMGVEHLRSMGIMGTRPERLTLVNLTVDAQDIMG